MLVTKAFGNVTWYANAVFGTGQVGSWTKDKGRAARVSEADADKVARFYRGKRIDGVMSFVAEATEATEATPAAVAA